MDTVSRVDEDRTATAREPGPAADDRAEALLWPGPFRRRVEGLLAEADIRVDGKRPWDMQVHDHRLFRRVCCDGPLGLGEAFMDGWWECPQLDAFFARVLRARLHERCRGWRYALTVLRARISNLQSRRRAWQVGKQHYDLDHRLYAAMLDPRLVYSCAYWQDSDCLADAQEAKLDLICRKLGLQPGMRVLDIGCGWGTALQFAAQRYGVSGLGVTISKKQAEYGRQVCAGLPVEIRLQDYRDLDERFDRVFSVGMFEHVGRKNYRCFMRVVRRCMSDAGLLLLHTIGKLRTAPGADPWTHKYIFPNATLPSAADIARNVEGLFVIEDWHSFGADYDRTLMAWYRNFRDHWPQLRAHYDTRFQRMWTYYLLSCAGAFRARENQLWQIVLSPRGVPGGYCRP